MPASSGFDGFEMMAADFMLTLCNCVSVAGEMRAALRHRTVSGGVSIEGVPRIRPLSCPLPESEREASRRKVPCVEGWRDWLADPVSSTPDGYRPVP